MECKWKGYGHFSKDVLKGREHESSRNISLLLLEYGHDCWNTNTGYSKTLGKSHMFRETEPKMKDLGPY